MLPAPEIKQSSIHLEVEQEKDKATDVSYPGVVYLSELPPYDELFRYIFIKNQLCVIGPHVTAEWKSRRLWVTKDGTPDFEYISQTFGDATGPVADCNGEEFCAHPKTAMTVKDFIQYWRQYKAEGYPPGGKCLYLKDWHFTKRFPDYCAYETPVFLCSDWLNEFYDTVESEQGVDDDYRFVYMGPKGSWTPFHSDVLRSYSWSANICGQKKWIFFPPGAEEMLKDRYGQLIFDLRSDELADVKKYPTANLALEQAVVVIQNPGEIVFVPSGWHHQVFNLEDTISINHNWMNGCSIQHTWNFLKMQLAAVQREISDCRDMEGWEKQCQMILKADAGMDYGGFYMFMATIAKNRLLALRDYLQEYFYSQTTTNSPEKNLFEAQRCEKGQENCLSFEKKDSRFLADWTDSPNTELKCGAQTQSRQIQDFSIGRWEYVVVNHFSICNQDGSFAGQSKTEEDSQTEKIKKDEQSNPQDDSIKSEEGTSQVSTVGSKSQNSQIGSSLSNGPNNFVADQLGEDKENCPESSGEQAEKKGSFIIDGQAKIDASQIKINQGKNEVISQVEIEQDEIEANGGEEHPKESDDSAVKTGHSKIVSWVEDKQLEILDIKAGNQQTDFEENQHRGSQQNAFRNQENQLEKGADYYSLGSNTEEDKQRNSSDKSSSVGQNLYESPGNESESRSLQESERVLQECNSSLASDSSTDEGEDSDSNLQEGSGKSPSSKTAPSQNLGASSMYPSGLPSVLRWPQPNIELCKDALVVSSVYLKNAWDTFNTDVLPLILKPDTDNESSEQFSYEEEPDIQQVYEQEPEDQRTYEPEPDEELMYEDEPGLGGGGTLVDFSLGRRVLQQPQQPVTDNRASEPQASPADSEALSEIKSESASHPPLGACFAPRLSDQVVKDKAESSEPSCLNSPATTSNATLGSARSSTRDVASQGSWPCEGALAPLSQLAITRYNPFAAGSTLARFSLAAGTLASTYIATPLWAPVGFPCPESFLTAETMTPMEFGTSTTLMRASSGASDVGSQVSPQTEEQVSSQATLTSNGQMSTQALPQTEKKVSTQVTPQLEEQVSSQATLTSNGKMSNQTTFLAGETTITIDSPTPSPSSPAEPSSPTRRKSSKSSLKSKESLVSRLLRCRHKSSRKFLDRRVNVTTNNSDTGEIASCDSNKQKVEVENVENGDGSNNKNGINAKVENIENGDGSNNKNGINAKVENIENGDGSNNKNGINAKIENIENGDGSNNKNERKAKVENVENGDIRNNRTERRINIENVESGDFRNFVNIQALSHIRDVAEAVLSDMMASPQEATSPQDPWGDWQKMLIQTRSSIPTSCCLCSQVMGGYQQDKLKSETQNSRSYKDRYNELCADLERWNRARVQKLSSLNQANTKVVCWECYCQRLSKSSQFRKMHQGNTEHSPGKDSQNKVMEGKTWSNFADDKGPFLCLKTRSVLPIETNPFTCNPPGYDVKAPSVKLLDSHSSDLNKPTEKSATSKRHLHVQFSPKDEIPDAKLKIKDRDAESSIVKDTSTSTKLINSHLADVIRTTEESHRNLHSSSLPVSKAHEMKQTSQFLLKKDTVFTSPSIIETSGPTKLLNSHKSDLNRTAEISPTFKRRSHSRSLPQDKIPKINPKGYAFSEKERGSNSSILRDTFTPSKFFNRHSSGFKQSVTMSKPSDLQFLPEGEVLDTNPRSQSSSEKESDSSSPVLKYTSTSIRFSNSQSSDIDSTITKEYVTLETYPHPQGQSLSEAESDSNPHSQTFSDGDGNPKISSLKDKSPSTKLKDFHSSDLNKPNVESPTPIRHSHAPFSSTREMLGINPSSHSILDDETDSASFALRETFTSTRLFERHSSNVNEIVGTPASHRHSHVRFSPQGETLDRKLKSQDISEQRIDFTSSTLRNTSEFTKEQSSDFNAAVQLATANRCLHLQFLLESEIHEFKSENQAIIEKRRDSRTLIQRDTSSAYYTNKYVPKKSTSQLTLNPKALSSQEEHTDSEQFETCRTSSEISQSFSKSSSLSCLVEDGYGWYKKATRNSARNLFELEILEAACTQTLSRPAKPNDVNLHDNKRVSQLDKLSSINHSSREKFKDCKARHKKLQISQVYDDNHTALKHPLVSQYKDIDDSSFLPPKHQGYEAVNPVDSEISLNKDLVVELSPRLFSPIVLRVYTKVQDENRNSMNNTFFSESLESPTFSASGLLGSTANNSVINRRHSIPNIASELPVVPISQKSFTPPVSLLKPRAQSEPNINDPANAEIIKLDSFNKNIPTPTPHLVSNKTKQAGQPFLLMHTKQHKHKGTHQKHKSSSSIKHKPHSKKWAKEEEFVVNLSDNISKAAHKVKGKIQSLKAAVLSHEKHAKTSFGEKVEPIYPPKQSQNVESHLAYALKWSPSVVSNIKNLKHDKRVDLSTSVDIENARSSGELAGMSVDIENARSSGELAGMTQQKPVEDLSSDNTSLPVSNKDGLQDSKDETKCKLCKSGGRIRRKWKSLCCLSTGPKVSESNICTISVRSEKTDSKLSSESVFLDNSSETDDEMGTEETEEIAPVESTIETVAVQEKPGVLATISSILLTLHAGSGLKDSSTELKHSPSPQPPDVLPSDAVNQNTSARESLDDQDHGQCPHWAHCGPNLTLCDLQEVAAILRDMRAQREFPAVREGLPVYLPQLESWIEELRRVMEGVGRGESNRRSASWSL